MVPEFLRALDEIRPRAFLMENVYGLASPSHRGYLKEILQATARLSFNIVWKVLYAADYGVPQKRRRLFLAGVAEGEFDFPEPTHGEGRSLPHVPAGQVIGNSPVGEPAQAPVWYAEKVDLRKSPYAGLLFNGGGRPIDLEQPCSTILASAGGNKTPWVDTLSIVPAYHAHLLRGGAPREGIVPGARRLSVEESALLQTFPEWLPFAGSKSSRFRQVGDAVPPRLAEVLGRQLVAQLTGVRPEGEDGKTIEPAGQAKLWAASA